MFLLEATRGILPEKVPVPLIAILAVWIILALPAVALSAAPEIFLQEEPETYLVIDKLEGMGFLPGLMTGARGLEAREVSARASFSGLPPPTGFLSRRVATSLRDPRGATPGGSRRHPFALAGLRQPWRRGASPSGGGREGTGAFFSRPMPNR